MKFADRLSLLEDDSLLKAFELKETKDMISFAAGCPSSETYPLDAIRESMDRVIKNQGGAALSYCSTSGYIGLREIMRDRMQKKFSINYDLDEIIITSGSQQGLDMSGMLFVNQGDVVLFESPSYLGAVNALRAYQAELVSVPTDRDGIKIEDLKKTLDKYKERVKMIYVNPDFQNPTGRSWSDQRRKDFMEFMADYEIPVLEDAAYGELSFEEKLQKPLAHYDTKGQVVYVGTFSKIFCPGLRVAWLCARRPIMEKYLVLKNAADLSSSTIAQMQMADYLEHNDIDLHIEKINKIYKERRDIMVSRITAEFPKEVHFIVPKGGLFIWLELPEGKDGRELLRRAIKENVSFIPGTSFYPSGIKNNEVRLNFSNMSKDEIAKGMAILGRLTRQYLVK
ncbi:MAG: PLP-dependent aminotransferase family protein [Anaerovoracaceae bacterium]